MNVYMHPERFGLELVKEVDWRRGYDYDMTVIWRDVDSDVWYWGRSSGCSCSSPFDGWGVADLEKGQWPQAFFEIEKFLGETVREYSTVQWKVDEVKALAADAIDYIRGFGGGW